MRNIRPRQNNINKIGDIWKSLTFIINQQSKKGIRMVKLQPDGDWSTGGRVT